MARRPPQAGGDLRGAEPFATSAEDAPLDGTQRVGPPRLVRRTWEAAEVDHPVDVTRASPEAPRDLGARHPRIGEAQHRSFERAQVVSWHREPPPSRVLPPHRTTAG